MTKLYKRDKKGNLLEWSIDHDNVSYWTISGRCDGKKIQTSPTFVKQKNVGKANETSLEQQVLNEVASKIQYQIDHGYTYEIPSEEKRFEVSLANKYQDRIDKNKLEFPYCTEEKLDGIRCWISMDCDGNIIMRSRKNKEFVACPHIKNNEIVKRFFKLYPDGILDGELYNHLLKDDFNKIVSLVKKTKPKGDDLSLSERTIMFYCFDAYFPSMDYLPYSKRKEIVLSLATSYEWTVGTNPKMVNYLHFYVVGAVPNLVSNENEVEDAITEAVSEGYEGIMLKKDVPYFFGRSFNMLKYKKFKDAEYRIVDFEEGKGNLKGIAAAVICETDNGEQFKAGVTGTQDYARSLYENRNEYVGNLATIKYQELTPMKDGKGGVPRFGKMIEIRNYE